MKKLLKDQITGSWKLVSWKYNNADNEYVDFFGENPQGILTYDLSGCMNAQLMRSERTSFASESITGGSIEEIQKAYFDYVAYWGKYYEKSPGEFVHEVEGSLFPNWIGHKKIRYAKIEDDYLTLTTAPIHALGQEIVFYLIWKRR